MIKATYIDHMGSDLSVVNSARVSFGKKSDWVPRVHNGEAKVLKQKDNRLIMYLAEHKHMSPFGHCFASFHVKAPIFVARQLVKHKFLRWNEISRRYVDSEPEFYEPKTWRGRAKDKKQGSSNEEVKEILVEGWKSEYPDRLKSTLEVSVAYDSVVNESALCLYKDMLHAGVCPEQARMVLPQSTMTEWYWSGSLDAFADMCILRCASDTQAETREVATQISNRMRRLFPVSWAALTDGLTEYKFGYEENNDE
jgi:thymidylate synthase (FAD)